MSRQICPHLARPRPPLCSSLLLPISPDLPPRGVDTQAVVTIVNDDDDGSDVLDKAFNRLSVFGNRDKLAQACDQYKEQFTEIPAASATRLLVAIVFFVFGTNLARHGLLTILKRFSFGVALVDLHARGLAARARTAHLPRTDRDRSSKQPPRRGRWARA